jgi:raffinose/stachyose/melibiose transport system substrate-binding protein
VMESVTFDGKVYGIPSDSMQPVVLFYNKKLFSEAGVQPPKTWDDLLALVDTFKAKGIAPFSLGGQSKWPNLMWEEYLVDRIGGPQVFKDIEAGKPNAWSHPAVLQANQMIQELVDRGAFVKGFSSIAFDTGQATALLYTGKAAMHLMGTWEYPGIQTAAPNFIKDGSLGWATFPTVPGGKGDPKNVVGNPANFYSVSAKANDKDKAVAIEYLSKGVMSESYIDNLLKGGAVPPVEGLESKLAGAENPEWLQFSYELAKDAPSFQLSWDQALSPGQADALLTNLDRLFLKQITPEQFSDNMNKAGK